jgi:hypothetical protein
MSLERAVSVPRIYEEERISERDIDSYYKTALVDHGYSHLIPLLNPLNESELLETTRECVKSPGKHPPEVLAHYRIGMKVVPPENMFSLCGTGAHAKGTIIVPTLIGKGIAGLSVEFSSLSFFLIDGAAFEATRAKPQEKQRQISAAAAFNPERVVRGGFGESGGALPPNFDGDLTMVSGWPGIYEAAIAKSLGKGLLAPNHSAKVQVIDSYRRPGFTRVQVTIKVSEELGRQNKALAAKPTNFLQMAFPEDVNGTHSASLRLLHLIMSRGHLPSPVLVVPIKGKNGTLECIKGAALDIYLPKEFQKIAYIQGEKERFLSPLLYEWPELAFPIGSWPEKFEHFLHAFRTWTWGNFYPLVNTPDTCDSPEESSLWFFDNIVYPVSSYPELLTPNSYSRERYLKGFAKSLIESLVNAFNGDPYLAFIRCLPEGETVKEIPAWGMGIFSEEGLFSNMGRYLKNPRRKERLLKAMRYYSNLGKNDGWEMFITSLLAETHYPMFVAELLTPDFYPEKPKEFSETVLRKTDDRLRY